MLRGNGRQDPVRQAAGQAMLACLPRLRRYARVLERERGAADDLVQDTLERAWQKLDGWRPGSDMRPWLFAIMHNLHVDQHRKGALETVELEAAHTMAMAQPDDAGLVLDLESALGRLPPEQREVLLLVALEEMRYEDVAIALGIPVGTVMSRLARGRERLRLLLLMDGQDSQGEGRPATSLKVVK